MNRTSQGTIDDFGSKYHLEIGIMTLEELKQEHGVQVIDRRISVGKFATNGGSRYYSRVRRNLKKRMDGHKEVFINFIPDEEITEAWILRTVLTLQRELTPNILVPTTTVEMGSLDEWISFFRPRRVVQLA